MTYRIAVIIVLLTLLAVGGCAQTSTPTFPAIPLPTAIAAFGAFNQLGTPRFTMGVSALYPVVGSIGVYGSTTADVFPVAAVREFTKTSWIRDGSRSYSAATWGRDFRKGSRVE
jgi:hypothetical protein